VQVSDTYSVDQCRNSYFGQLFPLNPGGIIPTGPTASDLKLGTDPKRGPLDMDSVFVTHAQEVQGAPAAP
jgi:putative glutathione S-transferase